MLIGETEQNLSQEDCKYMRQLGETIWFLHPDTIGIAVNLSILLRLVLVVVVMTMLSLLCKNLRVAEKDLLAI